LSHIDRRSRDRDVLRAQFGPSVVVEVEPER